MEKTIKRELPLKKNDDVLVRVDALGSEGQGIGRVEGYTLFIEGALPGELVRAHVLKTNSGYGIAKLLEVLEPSPSRVAPVCPSFGRCGGCTLQHLEYAAQLEAKRGQVKDALRKLGNLPDVDVLPTLGMETPWQYRNKGSFPFAMTTDGIRMGFFAPRSHRLIPVDVCPIQKGPVLHAAKTVESWAREYGVQPYDEVSHGGILRHVMVRCAQDGSTMVVVVTTGKLPRQAELVQKLRKEVPRLKSVMHNINAANTNVILGREYRCLYGEDAIIDTILGLKFRVSAASFLQVNPGQTEKLYSVALSYLGPDELPGAKVLDIYCGIGTISLLIARQAVKVIGIENVPEAVQDARFNAGLNGLNNAEFICAPAEDALPALIAKKEIPDAIVIDPPRKGCERPVLDAIIASGVSRVVYISCNPATLARDCAILVKEGGYKLEKIQPVDMFLHSAHVECVTLMSKVEK